MDTSSGSDNEFIPVGISMLNIHSKKPSVPVMAQKVEEDNQDLPSALQYYNLLSKAMLLLNKNKEDTERLKLGISVVRKNRKTFVNVVYLANQLKRQPEHLAHFISKNLMTE